MLRLLTLVLVLLLAVSHALAIDFTVGVSPPIVDLGEVERGSTKIVKFYLVTPSDEPLLVLLQTDRPGISFFTRDPYKDFMPNCSEEDVSSWLEFLKNPVELTVGNESLKTTAGEIRGWREVSFLLNVPQDAEPGYHAIRVKPVPYVPSESVGQAGARVVAITSVGVAFKVPGKAMRDGVILDVNLGSYSGNRIEVNTYFKNTGTVTLVASGQHTVYDDGSVVETISLPSLSVVPGETKVFKTYLPLEKLNPGNAYNISTAISYTTGVAYKNTTIQLPLAYVVAPPEKPKFNWLIILAIALILLIAIAIYKWYK